MSNFHKKDEVRDMLKNLTVFLADTYVVYYKTHAFHWNVEGANFYGIHLMFEKFYTDLWESADEVAERIRALGEKVPASVGELLQNATIAETETAPQPQIMARVLRDDYFALAKKAHDICVIATVHGDLVTIDLMTKRAYFLEKAAWMLHSTLID